MFDYVLFSSPRVPIYKKLDITRESAKLCCTILVQSREQRRESSEHVAGINKGSRLRPRSEKSALQVVGDPLLSAVGNQYFYFLDNIKDARKRVNFVF